MESRSAEVKSCPSSSPPIVGSLNIFMDGKEVQVGKSGKKYIFKENYRRRDSGLVRTLDIFKATYILKQPLILNGSIGFPTKGFGGDKL